MTDYQKSKVYAAEQSVRKTLDMVARSPKRSITLAGSTLYLPAELKFGSLQHAQDYCHRIQRSGWFRAAFPDAGSLVSVLPRRGNRFATYRRGNIYINPTENTGQQWALRELVVLHELAHHCTPHDEHGASFCAAFSYLVENAMSAEVAFLLQHALFEQGCVVHHQPMHHL